MWVAAYLHTANSLGDHPMEKLVLRHQGSYNRDLLDSKRYSFILPHTRPQMLWQSSVADLAEEFGIPLSSGC